MSRSPYPLQWPSGWPRTPASQRRRHRFGGGDQMSVYGAAKDLMEELRRLGATHCVITSFLPTRSDGLPYSDGRSDDPGIAVWFVHEGKERTFACDRWTTHAANMRAITLSIEAMRGLSRWGMADVVSRAFAGFAALPPPPPSTPQRRGWREIFDVTDPSLGGPALLAEVRRRWRQKIAAAHPDAGGTHEQACEINAALVEAESELTAPPPEAHR